MEKKASSKNVGRNKNQDFNDKPLIGCQQTLIGHSFSGSASDSQRQHNRGKVDPNIYRPPLPSRPERKVPTKYERAMEFVHEKKDYNVAEFYEHFRNDLPKTVMVNQGFYGNIVEDTFDREQILRVHAISKQPRVIAEFQYGNNKRLISIPLTYEEKLCTVKHGGRHGKPKPISAIAKDKSLPITVQFPKDHEITIGPHTLNTNNIPKMELTQTFEEVYLLSNYITDGVMSPVVVNIPLYLSQLRLVIVTGIKGQPSEKWTSYQEELDRIAAYITFDESFKNQNIAEYDPSAIHSDTTYEFVEPKAYSNIVSLVHKAPFRSFDNTTYNKEVYVHHEEGAVYEEIENTVRKEVAGQNKNAKLKKPVNKTFQQQLETSVENKREENTTPTLTSFKPQESHRNTLPPPIAPKPFTAHVETNGKKVPTLPERKAIPHAHKPAESSNSDSPRAIYTNDVPRTTIQPTLHVSSENEHKPVNEPKGKTLPEVNSADDVAKLTIEDVSKYMVKLRLEKYAETFKNNLVDGAMLAELDKDILKEDFDMKGIEALRLMKFAREGHVPV